MNKPSKAPQWLCFQRHQHNVIAVVSVFQHSVAYGILPHSPEAATSCEVPAKALVVAIIKNPAIKFFINLLSMYQVFVL